MIHESADVESAERFWANLVGADHTAFAKTTIKKHNPRTVRKNTGASCGGCLVIKVRQGADVYRHVEGWWSGMVVAGEQRTP